VRLPKFSKKVIAVGAATGLAMGAAGIAAAYFTNSGTGTGHAVVGTSGTFTATFTSVNPANLYPGKTQTITLTLTNNGSGTQHFTITRADWSVVSTTTASSSTLGDVKTTGGVHTGSYILGCEAKWFSFPATTARHPTPNTNGYTTGTVAAGGTTLITVTIHMSNTSTATTVGPPVNQDACKTVHPAISLSFTS
jgi:hypothetical protein